MPAERKQMCKFFSIITEPENHGGQRFYRDWLYRKAHLQDGNDSHSLICKANGLNEDVCNKYEYNPLTKAFEVDQINSPVDDSVQVEEWLNALDWKRIVEPLIVKPIIHPLKPPKVERVTAKHIQWLKDWASVRDSVGASVWASVWASVRDSVGASVRASVWDSVWIYISSFFDVHYEYDFSPCVKLWGAGLVPSFDGTTWHLHSGEKAEIVYTWKAK